MYGPRIQLLLIFFIAACLPMTGNSSKADIDLPVYSRIYDPQRDAFKDAHAAIANARASQRRIIVEVGGNWCAWCHRLDKFIRSDAEIYQALHRHFVILKINVSDENKNRKFLSAFPKPYGYPHMYVTESNGSIIYSKDTGEFLKNGRYAKENFLAFINQWKAKTTDKNH